MARVIDPGPTGRIGNLIFYSMYGKKYVRTMPGRVRQTKATKAKSTEFGRASTIGASIRRGLSPVIPDYADQKMQRRLVSVVFQWLNRLGEVKSIPGFQPRDLSDFSFLEKGSSIRGRWKVGVQISQPSTGLMQVRIPAFIPNKAFEAPINSVSVKCKIAMAAIDVKSGTLLGKSFNEIHFDLDSKSVAAQTLPVNLPTPKGSLIVTGMKLDYLKSNNDYIQPNTNKAYMPSEIVDAIYL
jgi:hypothetical protein